METNTTNNNEAPKISEDEIKLPEEHFGNAPVPEPSSGSPINILLIGLVVILLIILGAVMVWGEEILDFILGDNQTMSEPVEQMATTTEPVSEESQISELEAELDSVDFTEMEQEMAAIEAEINAEVEATTTSSSAQ